MDIGDFEKISDFVYRCVEIKEDRAVILIELSKRVIKESNISEKRERKEKECGFNEGNGRLVIKGKWPLDSYANMNRTCAMSDDASFFLIMYHLGEYTLN